MSDRSSATARRFDLAAHDPRSPAVVPGARRDRRRHSYLFTRSALPPLIWQVIKFTVLLLAIILIFFAFRAIVGPML
jgi:hypothetical protein